MMGLHKQSLVLGAHHSGTGSFVVFCRSHTACGLYRDAIQVLVHIANKILIKKEKISDSFSFIGYCAILYELNCAAESDISSRIL